MKNQPGRPATAPVRVRMTLSLEVDPAAWADAYGDTDATEAELRADVKNYIRHTLDQYLRGMENGAVLDLEKTS